MRDREMRRRSTRGTGSRLVGLLLMVWLAVGLLAAAQRHYFDSGPVIDCAGWGTIGLTTVVGPFNYLGMNPKVGDCELPQPSR
ncbi:hypothetical protein AB0C34_07450 [Nocardia sp. NPDC049220]|uniref:hypothetical protein n=1 Tax=Nocardia sp. NPDC049220 TaxID=3155273 RepID=UPI0033D0DAEE